MQMPGGETFSKYFEYRISGFPENLINEITENIPNLEYFIQYTDNLGNKKKIKIEQIMDNNAFFKKLYSTELISVSNTKQVSKIEELIDIPD